MATNCRHRSRGEQAIMKRAFVSGMALLAGLNALMGSAHATETPRAGELFAIANAHLEQGSAAGPPWTVVGDAYGVTAMAGFRGALYVASGDQLWRRGAIGPSAGNDWSYAGQAAGAVAMADHQ